MINSGLFCCAHHDTVSKLSLLCQKTESAEKSFIFQGRGMVVHLSFGILNMLLKHFSKTEAFAEANRDLHLTALLYVSFLPACLFPASSAPIICVGNSA